MKEAHATRMVYDFLRTKGMQAMLTQNLNPDFEPNEYLCKAFLAQLRGLDSNRLLYETHGSQDLLEDIAFYAHRLEIKTNASQVAILDEVFRIISKQGFRLNNPHGLIGYLEFLAHRKLRLYVRDVLEREVALPALAVTQLLASVIRRHATKYFPSAHDPQMVETLLKNGATPNGSCGDYTVWGLLLRSLDKRTLQVTDESPLQVIELTLLHGANPDLKVVIDRGGGSGQRATGRAADLYKTDLTKSAKDILCRSLGEETALSLLGKARPQNQSLFSAMTGWVTGARTGMLIRRFTIT